MESYIIWATNFKSEVRFNTEAVVASEATKRAHPASLFLPLRYIWQAAGGPIDGFWEQWSYHHVSPKVPLILEDLRIGRLSDNVISEQEPDLYDSEPVDRRGPGIGFPNPISRIFE